MPEMMLFLPNKTGVLYRYFVHNCKSKVLSTEALMPLSGVGQIHAISFNEQNDSCPCRDNDYLCVCSNDVLNNDELPPPKKKAMNLFRFVYGHLDLFAIFTII